MPAVNQHGKRHGKGYRYRQKYNEYKAKRMEDEKQIKGQCNIFELLEA